MKYLLDTNILSEPVKTSPQKSVLQSIERHQHENWKIGTVDNPPSFSFSLWPIALEPGSALVSIADITSSAKICDGKVYFSPDYTYYLVARIDNRPP